MIDRLREAVYIVRVGLCRRTSHLLGFGWVPLIAGYEAGPHVRRVYGRRCRWCGDEQ